MRPGAEQLRASLVRHFGVTPARMIASGMEAEVYALDEQHVLKLYPGTTGPARLRTLQQFYASLQPGSLSYALPRIDLIVEEQGGCITRERRLAGRPMSGLLQGMGPPELEQCMRTYLAAMLELQHVRFRRPLDRYMLFDEDGISSMEHGDWHQFLLRLLARRLHGVAPYLVPYVSDFEGKLGRLRSVLAAPYTGPQTLIHGDFFPGNLLVDPRGAVTALLDFGLLTMIGDPMFDIATSWVFFDMYDTLRANLRERYLALILSRLGEQTEGVLYRYVMLYSIIAANTYSPTCEDGHYRWCVANLNNVAYWGGLR